MRHPDEGTLVLHLDGALEGAEAREVAAHVEACDACAGRLAELARASRDVGAWIARHDPEPPPREAYDLRPRSARTVGDASEAGPARDEGDAVVATPATRRGSGVRWRRWAAAAAVVVAVGSLVTPVRALILEHVVDNVRTWLVGDDGPAPATAADGIALPDAITASPATAFVHAGPEVTLRFAAADTRGELTLVPAADSLVTLWIREGDVPLVVRGDVVEIRNGRAPEVGYRLALPPGVAAVRVAVGSGDGTVVDVTGLREARNVRLGTPSPSGGARP